MQKEWKPKTSQACGLPEVLEQLPLSLTVQRRKVFEQATAVFEDWDDEDWEKNFTITFSGERGVDGGGLRREFFTLYFNQCGFMEGGTLRYENDLLEKQHYQILGRVAARAILLGHPGVGAFSDIAASYILTEETPDSGSIKAEEVMDVEARQALLEVSK